MLTTRDLFDDTFYRNRYPEVNQAIQQGLVKSGLEHFKTIGQFKGLDPSPLFDTSFYLNKYPGVKTAVQQGKITAIQHFIKYGEVEGLDPITGFDTNYYKQKNPDVENAVKSSATKSDPLTEYEHYVKFGKKEGLLGRRPNVIIFVTDGLRPSSINPTDAPTLSSLRQNGVNFTNSHSLFPTFTTPNASAIATGHYLGDTGDFSNTIYTGVPIPSAGGSLTPFIESDPVLGDIDERFPGQDFLNEEAVLAAARKAGLSTAAVGKLGPIAIQDITQDNRVNGTVPPPQTIIIDDATGTKDGIPLNAEITAKLQSVGLSTTPTARNQPSGTNTTPGTTSANVGQQQYFADATTKAILPLFKDKNQPFVMVYWSRDPDGTQHNQGDSLNSLTPGINGPTSKAGVKNADNNLKQILDELQAEGLADTTDVFVTADHGFSTISKQSSNSYAASLPYSGVNPGFLPKGFLAIDLAKALDLPLYDPDSPVVPLSNGNVQYVAVDPTSSNNDPTKGPIQLPKFGNGLLGGTGQVTNNKTDAQVAIAANGGSDLIYLPNGNPTLAKQIVDSLSKQDYVSGIFADDSFGNIPGTLPLSSIGLKGSAITPVPALIVNFKTFATDPTNPLLTGVEIADTGLQQGQGMHGSFSRADTFNNMVAIGPDFKKSYTDLAPVSNADVGVTISNLLGLPITAKGSLVGRVISESLTNGPASVPSTSEMLQSTPTANGLQTVLKYQKVGNTPYFDAAGFPGRTLGL